MSTKTQVNVDIITEVKGLQKLTQAQKDMNHLRESVLNLGKAFVGAFAAREILNFAKASVQAFAANQKQVALLTNTLKNLGLGFDALNVNSFIDHLALASGRTKEELIPAFQGLVVATGSVSKAQDALKVAMDVSAATGKELSVVQIAISKGFLGNTTALTRLGAGLDKATLKTGDMNVIMAKLSATFGGSAAVAADTFQGKLDKMNVALTEAKVNIGTGLVDAFTQLAGSGNIDKANEKVTTFSKTIGDLIATLAGARQGIFANMIDFKFGIIPVIKPGLVLDKYPAQQSPGARAAAVAAELKAAQIKLKAEQATAKALADQKKAVADKLALERSSLSLKLAGSTADMQNIEIQAALQRGQTEQVNNVLLLQRALITGNADEANVLAQKVLTANGLVMDVNGNITALAGAKDPFKDWPTAAQSAIDQLKKVNDYLATIKDKTITITVKTVTTTSAGGTTSGTTTVTSTDPNAPGAPGTPLPPTFTPQVVLPKNPLVPGDYGFVGPVSVQEQQTALQKIIDSVSLTDANAQNSFTSGVTNGESVAAAISGARYAAQGIAANGGGAVTINISAPPSTTVTTTQDASTNGTPVTVNRNNPFGMYSV